MNDQMALSASPEPAEISPNNASVIAQASNLKDQLKLMQMVNRTAERFANSTMVPTAFQGKPDNCFVACELANRMNVSPTFVMQNLIVVQGKPSWSGQACIALINGCGRYENLNFVEIGTKGEDDWGCFCQATRKLDGELVSGEPITMEMADREGWLKKNGSKWQTMPGQMLKYRAASFFARVYCPEVLMGFSTEGEVEDVQQQDKVTITL